MIGSIDRMEKAGIAYRLATMPLFEQTVLSAQMIEQRSDQLYRGPSSVPSQDFGFFFEAELHHYPRAAPKLHMLNHVVAEFGAFDLDSALHESREIISDTLRSNGSVQPFQDQICGFSPAHVAEH